MSLRPYLTGFRLALSQELIHRSNFAVGHLRNLIFFGALILLFKQLPQGVGPWQQNQLLTYTLISAFISSQIVTQGMHTIASEITDGDLTNFLLRPINYLGYCIARILASRTLAMAGSLISIAILTLLLPSLRITLPSSPATWLMTGLLFLGSLILMQLIDFIGGLLSFWTDRSFGPRFLIHILIQFFSGVYLPINTFPSLAQKILSATPFPSLAFVPTSTLINGITAETFFALRTQFIWIILLSIAVSLLWYRGVKSYAAYGR